MATTAASAKRQASAAVKRAKDEAASGAEDVAERATTAGRRASREAEALQDSLMHSAEELVANVSSKLKAVGVDTDKMADVAKEQATDLQRLIVEEIRERPLRALGLAAAVGLFVGFLSAR
ncbi:hypothetical protein DWF00_01345 [Bosea caraganae]|uniref:DUF883 domain-containing protein n=1 Tax=Bosea caraganae TaxID=2763117 RepID=A0A370LA43_9HYPH|nr:DUF883 C-terminal domain-containing protein [Bosea caraganae]RDJ26852.1 hypothetical protein DWE98_08365 [Bosea caraganae]RDJ30738.1 hypothetical protein DWF00_01345 [Bosea caraganae]